MTASAPGSPSRSRSTVVAEAGHAAASSASSARSADAAASGDKPPEPEARRSRRAPPDAGGRRPRPPDASRARRRSRSRRRRSRSPPSFEGEPGAEIAVDGKSRGQDARAPGSPTSTVGKTLHASRRSAPATSRFTGEFTSDGEPRGEGRRSSWRREPPPSRRPKPRRAEPPKPAPWPRRRRSRAAPSRREREGASSPAAPSPRAPRSGWTARTRAAMTPVAAGQSALLPVGNRKVVFKLNGKQTKPQTVDDHRGRDVAKLINVPSSERRGHLVPSLDC